MVTAKEVWRIELFGGLRAQRGDRVVTHFETRKIVALLACLSLRLQRTHPREVLAEQLWPEEDWDATRNRLRHALSSLRRDLEPEGIPEGSVLVANRADAWLDSDAVTTDVAEFETALERAVAAHDPLEQVTHLQQAIALYRGELLPGYYEDWISRERERLAAAYCTALRRLAGALAATGDLVGAIEAARRLLSADPVREDGHCDLMRFFAAAGRTSEALRQYRELERVLREELGAQPSLASKELFEQLRTAGAASPTAPAGSHTTPVMQTGLEPEGGAVPLDSRFYVVRPTDAEFHAAIARQDSIVLVKGPRQVGKTSLLARGLQQAREAGARVVLTDLQKLAPEQLESAAALFQAFAEMISDQLDLDVALDDVWNPRRGWNVNFERFLRRAVLNGAASTPLVWGLDEVDRLFNCPFSSVVFGLFRSWHNERSLNPGGPWGRLTLAIAYATEAHLFITDLNQSPFNVGTRLALEDFTRGEVAELNRRYGAPVSDEAGMTRYSALVGGHPYLVRRGLHAMVEQGLDPAALEAGAAHNEGPFGDHLRRMLALLTQDAGLCDAVRAVLRGRPCPTVESFYRLRSAGVIGGKSLEEAQLRCGLYRIYLERHLL
jgi:DNA-binding SARP family transcriptional activator